ncbi:MAG: hypothetical protein VZR28_11145 [Candidatus Cryptobacteroides sp.]|nr:hypothetical protein [Candidatus Cryptobacteroides sp.]
MKKKNTKPKPRRTLHLDTRVSQEESNRIRRKAEECGLTASDYMRKCALGHSPKQHLTDKEIEAYMSLYEARRDLIAITNALKGKTKEEKLRIFGDESFMKRWVRGVRVVLVYWDNKIKMMNE